MDSVEAIVREAAAEWVEAARGRDRRVNRADLARLVDAVVRAARGFELVIPGRHGKVSNQDILDFRQAEGRDFAAWTNALKAHLRAELLLAFEDARALPSARKLRDTASDAIVAWVVRRIDYRVRDVRIPLLTPAYAKRKRAAGHTGPVGVRTGDWRDAVADRARAIFPG